MSETPIAKITLPNEIFFADVAALVKQGHAVTISAKGASMYPFIRPSRDRVVLSAPASVSVGDIVLALLDGSNYVLHRVESIDGESVCLMGDGNICGTEQCVRDEVIAKAVRIIKGKKQIDCTGRCHRVKATLWRWLLPVRRYLLAIYRRIFKY